MSIRLESLIEGLQTRLEGDPGVTITDVVSDSRRAEPGALFVALRGERTDGHRFLDAAVAAGAAALLVEEPPRRLARPVAWAQVPDTRTALPIVASRLFGNPGEAMTLIGVTGTNGKTSTVRMIEAILDSDGRRAGSLGTISVRYGGVEFPSLLTTPEADDLQRTLARMRDAGLQAVAMEISSHALARRRVDRLAFDCAVFTNLTQDHLDFHGDMETYARAKRRLFEAPFLHGPAVINVDDPVGRTMAQDLEGRGKRVVTFGRRTHVGVHVRTTDERVGLSGSRIEIDAEGEQLRVTVPLPGDFQVENALAAIAAACALGIGKDAICRGIETCPQVPGRLEQVGPGSPVVLVDYAHTPDALDRVLERLRPLVPGRLITVFGCGGDRDRTKRVPMARAACRHSDLVVATSDNPRSEDPAGILRDIEAGLSGSYEILPDRRDAIQHAITEARAEDVILIAGKGHERVQIVGSEQIPFDDREEGRRALKDREADG